MYETVLTKENFDNEVLESDLPVLVDFWATWCGPCMMLAPTIEQIAKEYGDKYKVCKVDVDDQPELAMRFGINTIPTLLIFKDGNLTETSVGVRTMDYILDLLEK
ncbi:MAG: thioredoxin [Clostridia bacterium]|nr:thioredoxin [Clostridia bacterium]